MADGVDEEDAVDGEGEGRVVDGVGTGVGEGIILECTLYKTGN